MNRNGRAGELMADRTGAAVLGEVFLILAEEPDERAMRIAKSVWERAYHQVDCTWDQMGVDGALEELGLIRKVEDGWVAWDEKE